MESDKGLVVVLLVIGICGLLFLGIGITGKAIGNTSLDYCTSDTTCANGKVCCIINGNGLCYEKDICDNVQLTKEKPDAKDAFLFQIGLGILILVCVIAGYFSIKKRRRELAAVKSSKRGRARNKKKA